MIIANIIGRTINIQETIEAIRGLSTKIAENFQPDSIVCVCRGGILPGLILSEEFGIPLFQVLVTRGIHLEHLFWKTPMIFIPFIEMYYGYKHHTARPYVVKEPRYGTLHGRVLVVDDTFRTGQTMSVVLDYARRKGATVCRSASLCWTGTKRPDYYWCRGRFAFPWSRASKYYLMYLEYIVAKGIRTDGIPTFKEHYYLYDSLYEKFTSDLIAVTKKEHRIEILLEYAHQQILNNNYQAARNSLYLAKELICEIGSVRWFMSDVV